MKSWDILHPLAVATSCVFCCLSSSLYIRRHKGSLVAALVGHFNWPLAAFYSHVAYTHCVTLCNWRICPLISLTSCCHVKRLCTTYKTWAGPIISLWMHFQVHRLEVWIFIIVFICIISFQRQERIAFQQKLRWKLTMLIVFTVLLQYCLFSLGE